MSDVSSKIRQAMKLAHEGKPRDAEAALARMLQQQPTHAGLNRAYSQLMFGVGDVKRALHFAALAAHHNQTDPESLLHFGQMLLATGQSAPAIDVLKRLLALDPRKVEARTALVGAYLKSGRSIDAEEICREGLQHRPNDPRLLLQLGMALLNSTRVQESIDTLRTGTRVSPNDPYLAEALACTFNYLPNADADETLNEHKRQAKLTVSQTRISKPKLTNTLDPDRKLRLAFISADLRSHSVGFFVEPIFANLNREQFSIAAYFSGRTPDTTSERLRGMVDTWRNISETDHDRLVKGIVHDEIDILIDLSGLAYGHRLPALTAKPAPLIVTYLGYPNTTGCDVFDARIVDSMTDPAGSESRAVEKLVRLDPCFLCYQPPREVSETDRSSSTRGEGIVFGSFNSLPKINDELITLWARVLDAVPNSKLMLKNAGLTDERTRQFVAQRMQSLGIAAERLTLMPWSSDRSSHLQEYANIDIALDTFPYHGTTTTCEALFMGVPVVTLAGDIHASRVGVSLLNNVGVPELVADTPERYVTIASELARDRDRLSSLHSTLRDQLTKSPLCDAPAFARHFENVLRTLWREHCNGAER